MRPTKVIDCAGVRNEAEFWQRYLDAADPPGRDVFGKNLDAFWDAIESGGPGFPGNVRLIFAKSADLAQLNNGKFLRSLKTIGREASGVELNFE